MSWEDTIGGGTVSEYRCACCGTVLLGKETVDYLSFWECPDCEWRTLTSYDAEPV